jgi:hypothetical protein
MFLLIILLVSTKFMGIYFLQSIPYDEINIIFSLFFIGYSFFIKSNRSLKIFKNTLFFIKMFIIAFILSTITAYLDWNQDFITTIMASRSLLWLSFGFYLIKSKTKLEELYSAFYIFSWIYCTLSILIALVPSIKPILLFQETELRMEEAFFAGIQFILIPLYFIIEKIYNKKLIYSHEYVLFIISLIAIYLSSNRATLFTILIIIIFSSIFYWKTSVIKKGFLMIILFLFFSYVVYEKINVLFEESIEQLNDKDYPRIKAFYFFTNDFSKSNLGYAFGNGVASSNVSYGQYVDTLKTRDRIYHSDMGLLGTWVYFGIFSLFAILIPIARMIFSSREFLGFKFLGLHIIIGFTMFLFLREYSLVFMISILYLLDYKTHQLNYKII